MYPRTFHEFYEQFPDIIRLIIIKSRWAEWDDVADLEQEILSELLRSKSVEKFNPDIYEQGANTRLFIQYIKHCATRVFLTTHDRQKRHKRSINNSAVSLSDPVPTKQTGKSAPMISDTIHDGNQAQRAIEASLEFEQFASYVIATEPNLEDIINAIRELGSTHHKDIAEHTGMKVTTVQGRMPRLHALARRWNAK